jgi:WD40 repeat protein
MPDAALMTAGAISVSAAAAAAAAAEAAAAAAATTGERAGPHETGAGASATSPLLSLVFPQHVQAHTHSLVKAASTPPNLGATVPYSYSGAPRTVPSLYTLAGHRNKNWPIRCSFYCGDADAATISAAPGANLEAAGASFTPPRGFPSANAALPATLQTSKLSSTVLLATGSASPSVYVFALLNDSRPELMQKLRGHAGRVYACEFNRSEPLPVLASCSADSTVRIWTVHNQEH